MFLKEQCILGIDGSGFSVSVGVMVNGIPAGLNFVNNGSPGSEILLVAIDQLLTTVKIAKEDLDGICVATGPGSFTSLRISLSTAEALGLGLNIPVYGVNSLLLIAATIPYYPFTIKVIQNAYKGEFYTASYHTKNGITVELDKPRLISPAGFYEHLEEEDLILGNGIEELIRKKFDLSEKRTRWNKSFHSTMTGIGVIEHFLDSEAKKPSLIPLEPVYIRPSDAEINYSRQFGGNG